MKQIFLIISFLTFVLIANAQVTKLRVFIEDFKFDNDGINVHYAFENCNDNDRFFLWIETHTESGKIYKAKSLLRDVENVIPAGTHRLVWFTGKDGILIEEKITLKIFASAMPNPKMSKAFVASAIFPGAGHKYAGEKHNKLYENLNNLGTQKATVILDACFSGSFRKNETLKDQNLISQKVVKIKMTNPWISNTNFTMISLSGKETSLGLDDSQTGLFTYHLCTALHGKADENGDEKITFGKLKKYVKTNIVSYSKKNAEV